MGGEGDNPTEENDGGHAEVVEVIFDPERLSYRGLLEVFFLVHRPDLDVGVVGSIYRSEIFYTSPEQRRVAEAMIRDVDASRHWLGRTVTKVSPAGCSGRWDPRTRTAPCDSPPTASPPFPTGPQHRRTSGTNLNSSRRATAFYTMCACATLQPPLPSR